ncbi:PAS domain S-box protein [Geotalea sp. SG265]|uniref:PAS domain S-box protein n=1 Tax=Geotalea sp. SG265 TaxID=2922867 RepID=UPI001FAEDF90|nr:PAS domain S-box protein [Geotalea sp. SG265]
MSSTKHRGKAHIRISLRTKIALTTSAFVVLFMSFGACSSLFYFDRHQKIFIYGQQASLASSMADEIDGKIATFQAEVTAVAKRVTPELLRDREKAQQFLDEKNDSRLMFDNGFYLFLANGKILAGAPMEPGLEVANYSFREYFKRTMQTGKSYISDPYFTSKKHHHPVVMFTAPVLDRHGKVLAFIGGSIDLMKDNFLGKVASAKIGKNGYFCIVSRQRLLILHPYRERILRDVVPAGSNRLLDRAFAGSEETGETVTSLGVPMVSSFRHLKTTGWVLSANSPQSEAYAPIDQTQRFMLLAVPIVAGLSIVTVWYMLGMLTAPLRHLTAQVRTMATADEQKPIALDTGDEIGALAGAFNRLVVELNKKRKTVQEQLRFLQTLMDTIPAPVFYKDMAGRYLGCNTAFMELIGVTRDRMIGKTVHDLAPKALAEIYDSHDLELAERQGVQVYESQVRCADGGYRHVIFYKALFTSIDEVPEGLVGVMLDITDRKCVEEKVREMEERFHQLFSQNWDAILLLSPESFRILDANPAAGVLFDCDRNDLIFQELSSLMDEADTARLAALVAGSADAESVQLDKAAVRGKQGISLTVSVRCKKITIGSNEILYCSFRDIGERMRLQKEMKETQAKLIHANRMTALGVLTAGVAHEINNPNSYISANAALLAETWSDAMPVLRRHVEEHGEICLGGLPFSEMEQVIPRLCSGLTEGSRRIADIIDNLKGFYRDEKGAQAAAFDLNKAISDGVSILSHHIHRHTNNFSLALGQCLPPARGRSQQIEQVVINLVMNALQALRDKSGAVSVASAFVEQSGCVSITVKDEGRGMSPEVLERLTEPFFSTRLDEGGTGLGLSITDTIIKEHGGSLLFKSVPGEGTTATLYLPTAPGAGPASAAAADRAPTVEYPI